MVKSTTREDLHHANFSILPSLTLSLSLLGLNIPVTTLVLSFPGGKAAGMWSWPLTSV